MNVLAIIAEYNPFHNGHLKHIEKSIELSRADATIAIMGGNWMQRGEPALVDKWKRAKMALNNGVDLVIELPTVYATQSAEIFAHGAVKLIKEMKIVNSISFGSESGDISKIDVLADLFLKEPKEFKTLIAQGLSEGVSYPKALTYAVSKYLYNGNEFAEILESPNNTLAIEYVKALKKQKVKATAITIGRDNSHNSDSLEIVGGIASGSTIRKLINKNMEFHKAVSFETFENIINAKRENKIVYSLESYEKIILYTLRTKTEFEISQIADVTEGLENRIKKAALNSGNLRELIDNIKTKRYTEAKIRRILVSIMLNITKKDIENAKKTKPYIRVLAFNNKGKKLISQIASANSKAEIVVSVSNYVKSIANKNKREMIEKDIFATDIYTLGYSDNFIGGLDFTTNSAEIK